MGSLDYVSPDATFVMAFAVKNSAAIVDQVMGVLDHLPMVTDKTRSDVQQQNAMDVRDDLAASLGGEFSLSLDGAPFPVPSWKLVTEVYDPTRLQATLTTADRSRMTSSAAKSGDKALRTCQEVVDGRTYYMIASGDPQPADRGPLHLRRRLPDRRTHARPGQPRAPDEDGGHVHHALRALHRDDAARSLLATSRR